MKNEANRDHPPRQFGGRSTIGRRRVATDAQIEAILAWGEQQRRLKALRAEVKTSRQLARDLQIAPATLFGVLRRGGIYNNVNPTTCGIFSGEAGEGVQSTRAAARRQCTRGPSDEQLVASRQWSAEWLSFARQPGITPNRLRHTLTHLDLDRRVEDDKVDRELKAFARRRRVASNR